MHNFIGIPYEEMNCWQLVRYYYAKELSIELPTYPIDPDDTFYVARTMVRAVKSGAWTRHEQPVKHAVAVFCTKPECRAINHVGIVISKTTFLHTFKEPPAHSHIARLNEQPWQATLRGFYTWNK